MRDTVAALSMRWAKGTLGNFMIHDEASGIILDVCMCHCILIMAPVSWKRRHTFKGDNLIFSSLRLLSTPCWANTCLWIPVKGGIAYILHLGSGIIKQGETGNDRWSQANQEEEVSPRFKTQLRKINTERTETLLSSLCVCRVVVGHY